MIAAHLIKKLLLRAKITSLYVSKNKSIAIETYTCIHPINPKCPHAFFHITKTGYLLKNPHRVELRKEYSTPYGLISVSFQASNVWNDIPATINDTIDFDVSCYKSKIGQDRNVYVAIVYDFIKMLFSTYTYIIMLYAIS